MIRLHYPPLVFENINGKSYIICILYTMDFFTQNTRFCPISSLYIVQFNHTREGGPPTIFLRKVAQLILKVTLILLENLLFGYAKTFIVHKKGWQKLNIWMKNGHVSIVIFEKVLGSFACPASSFAHKSWISWSETKWFSSKIFVSQSAPIYSGFALSLIYGIVFFSICSIYFCFWPSSRAILWSVRSSISLISTRVRGPQRLRPLLEHSV